MCALARSGALLEPITIFVKIALCGELPRGRGGGRGARDLGYRVVKFYPLPAVGPVEGLATLRNIVGCCEAVRDGFGDDADFALDFHGRLSAGLAVEVEAAVRHTKPLWKIGRAHV